MYFKVTRTASIFLINNILGEYMALLNINEIPLAVKDYTEEDAIQLGADIVNLEFEIGSLFKEEAIVAKGIDSLETLSTVTVESSDTVKEMYANSLQLIVNEIGGDSKFIENITIESMSRVKELIKVAYNTVIIFINKLTRLAKKLWVKMLTFILLSQKDLKAFIPKLKDLLDSKAQMDLKDLANFMYERGHGARYLFDRRFNFKYGMAFHKTASSIDGMRDIYFQAVREDKGDLEEIKETIRNNMSRELVEPVLTESLWADTLEGSIVDVLKDEDTSISLIKVNRTSVKFFVVRPSVVDAESNNVYEAFPVVDTVTRELSNVTETDIYDALSKSEHSGTLEYFHILLTELGSGRAYRDLIDSSFESLDEIDSDIKKNFTSANAESIKFRRKTSITATKAIYDMCQEALKDYRSTMAVSRKIIELSK